MVVERLSDLPAELIDALVAESEQAGWRFMRRLAEEWASGANRFNGAGEAFFAALIGGRVIGVCGLNVDPYTVAQGVGRVRHLYVLSAYRRPRVGRAEIRIDHTGSTAVPGLGAKDVIDIQITVADLDSADGLTHALRTAGFRHGTTFEHDLFHTKAATDPELRKLYMREPEGERRAHIHIREGGRFNQRYALLFRDYLRSAEDVRTEYELV